MFDTIRVDDWDSLDLSISFPLRQYPPFRKYRNNCLRKSPSISEPSFLASELKADVFNAKCLSRNVLDLLAEKWVLLIVHSLSERPKRTGELRRHVDGISEKMLIQTLRNLERHGFVARRAFSEVPPRVEYALTPLGARLSELVKEFDHWVEANCADIMTAQQQYDQTSPSA